MYGPEVKQKVCELLAQGIPLSKICKMKDMPTYMTVLTWQKEDAEFSDSSARAKQDGTHALADEALEIADDPLIDPADKRIRIDTRIRLIGKWNARAYGDKLAHTGPDGSGPVQVNVQRFTPNADTDTE